MKIKLSDFLRYAVDSHNAELVSIKDEMQFVNNYIDLQKIRFEDAFHYKVDVPDEIFDKKVPVFTIQTLVENAFKHSMDTQLGNIEISMDITIKHSQLFFSISNTYDKSSKKSLSPTGVGLLNTKQRLELLYPEKR